MCGLCLASIHTTRSAPRNSTSGAKTLSLSDSALEARAPKLWFDAEDLWVRLADGRQLSVPLAYFPRLLRANDEQRQTCIISGGGSGLYMESLDEDISVAYCSVWVIDLEHGPRAESPEPFVRVERKRFP